MSTTTTKKRIRIPSVSVDAEVSLDEFSTDEIRKYLQDIGEEDGSGGGGDGKGCYLTSEDLNRIETLALCGQTEHAKALALQVVGDVIGRVL